MNLVLSLLLLALPSTIAATLLFRRRPRVVVALGRWSAWAILAVVLAAFASGWPILMGRRATESLTPDGMSIERYAQLHAVHAACNYLLILGGGMVLPFLIAGSFRRNASLRSNVRVGALAFVLGLFVFGSSFSGFLVPSGIGLLAWANTQLRLGNDPDGAVLRFVVFHNILLPGLVALTAAVLGYKLKYERKPIGGARD